MPRAQVPALVAAAIACSIVTATTDAAPFAEGSVVVSQIGDVEVNVSGDASPIHLIEVNPADPDGTIVQDLPLPTVTMGDQRRITLTSYFRDGHLKLSPNGLFLTIGGYDAEAGVGIEPNEADPALVNRIIARIDQQGNIDTTTALTDCYGLLNNNGGMHSVITSDGRNFWMTGRAGSGTNQRVRHATLGATISTRLNGTNDPRVIGIFFDQLYASYNTSNRGVYQIGTGLPTEAGQSTTGVAEFYLPDSIESGSPYDFYFLDQDTGYLCDDRTPPALGGVGKYTRDTVPESPTFGMLVYRYSLNAGLDPLAQAIKAMTVRLDDLNRPVIFAITAEDQQEDFNRLVMVTDTGCPTGTEAGCSGTDTFVTVQTSPEGTVFRGVALAPRGCEGDECIGACCGAGATCSDTTQAECDGVWRGLATSCELDTCPLVCGSPFADADNDDDVDQHDFAAFQLCYTGAGGGPVTGECQCFDRAEDAAPEGDGDVDQMDFDRFSNCTSGPEVTADPDCDDPPPPV